MPDGNFSYPSKAEITGSSSTDGVYPPTSKEELDRKRFGYVGTIPSTRIDYSIYSEEFINCGLISLEKTKYQMLADGTAYVPKYDKFFNASNYMIDDKEKLRICPNFFLDFIDDKKFPPILEIVTTVGVGISIICIFLHMIMFVLVKKLRNLPGYSLISLCVALLVAYISFFAQFGIPEESDCTAIGMLMFYFFLASFFWMNAMSYDVWRSLRMATSKLRLTSNKSMMFRFGLYSLYSWGVPLLIVIVALIIDSLTENRKYKLIFRVNTCWFRYRQALLVYFALPLFILLFINIIFYVSSFYMILTATMNTSENKANLQTRFLISMRLAVVMGLMWIFGVLAVATQSEVLWYFYAICNTLQGVFIFFSFTLTEKTRKECRTLIHKKKTSFLPTTQTSSQQMTTF
ncbi:latrophilin receptor-like protein A [Uloborus diversus]|uniref:latrophilin receptor-like protein A n=1 Tax=Uloborus diversus TaxID=327109 RepID=UPI00240A0B5E|nr:latrophilin receptor-like protein A [Uloborus diversus]